MGNDRKKLGAKRMNGKTTRPTLAELLLKEPPLEPDEEDDPLGVPRPVGAFFRRSTNEITGK